MNELLSSLKWIVGGIILIAGLHLGVEAYKTGESTANALGVSGFGVLFLLMAAFLGGSSNGGEGTSQEHLEHYRSTGQEHDDGWNG